MIDAFIAILANREVDQEACQRRRRRRRVSAELGADADADADDAACRPSLGGSQRGEIDEGVAHPHPTIIMSLLGGWNPPQVIDDIVI